VTARTIEQATRGMNPGTTNRTSQVRPPKTMAEGRTFGDFRKENLYLRFHLKASMSTSVGFGFEFSFCDLNSVLCKCQESAIFSVLL
jgi:hypothetical protein